MQHQKQLYYKLGLTTLVVISETIANQSAFAQLVPDNTLGTESSIINQIDNLKDRIEGGATRGTNLFHSFQEFNVDAGKSVYFANPVNIENILTRVTGGNISNILGKLGVEGTANLFLINPNGIYFGKDVSLDISGSFTVTAADGIQLGTTGVFSAKDPQSSNLLSVQPGALFINALINQQTEIKNEGNLTVGQNLTFNADNINLLGKLQAGNNLTLQANNILKIRDSVTQPFIASAGGNLLIQGNQLVDIFALNNPHSGLFSGGDMVLRSANTVGGDAHYWTGGNFRIEQLDGNLGNLDSPDDPIIRSSGDVSFASYTGASLHIFAGGSVNIPGNITITGTDTTQNSIQEIVTLSDGTQININGSTQPTLDIRAGTTAFGTPGIIGNTSGFSSIPGTGGTGTSADINIGSITNNGGTVFVTNQYFLNPSLTGGEIKVGAIDTSSSNDGGNVTLNARSNITTKGINSEASGAGNGGNINLISTNGSIDTTGGKVTAQITEGSNGSGNAGSIIFIAKNDIKTGNLDSSAELGNGSSIQLTSINGNINTTSYLATDTNGGNAGEIKLNAYADITTTERLVSIVNGKGNGGSITLNAGGNITTNKNDQFFSYSKSDTNAGNGGAITFNAGGNIDNGFISSYSSADGFSGNGGAIIFNAKGYIHTRNLHSMSISNSDSGNGGVITLNAGGNIFTEQVASYSYSSSTSGLGNTGNGGAIVFTTTGGNIFTTEDIYSLSSSLSGNAGNGGAIAFTTAGGNIFTDSTKQLYSFSSSVSGNAGNGGAINFDAQDGNIIGIGLNTSSVSQTGKAGIGGKVTLKAKSNVEDIRILTPSSESLSGTVELTGFGDLSLTNISMITSKQETINLPFAGKITINIGGSGQSGNVNITSLGNITFNNSRIESDTKGSDPAGNVTITSPGLITFNNSQIITNTSNIAQAGSISIEANQGLTLDSQSSLSAKTNNTGNAGSITLKIPQITLKTGANIAATTENIGNAGNINLQPETNGKILAINLQEGSSITSSTSNQGKGGNLIITAPDSIIIQGKGRLFAGTTGEGEAVKIEITTKDLTIKEAEISASTTNKGKAGNIQINANNFKAESGGKLTTTTSAAGQAGTINLKIKDNLHLTGEGTGIFANTEIGSTGAGGSIDIDSINMLIENGASVSNSPEHYKDKETINMLIENGASVRVNSQGTGIAGNIKIEARSLTLNKGTISAETVGGEGGNITLNVDDNILLRYKSLISAEAKNAGDGGNIDINTTFVLAYLSEDSDVLANAFGGTGGNISSSRDGKIKGLGFRQFEKKPTPDSDFIASSEMGLDGVVNLEQNQQSLSQLPTDFINVENLNKDVCAIKDDKIAGGSSFVITGKGGLPADTHELISNSPAFVEWENSSDTVTQANLSPVKIIQKNTNHHQQIQQAQGWIINPNGKVILTANAAKITLQTDKNNLPTCK